MASLGIHAMLCARCRAVSDATSNSRCCVHINIYLLVFIIMFLSMLQALMDQVPGAGGCMWVRARMQGMMEPDLRIGCKVTVPAMLPRGFAQACSSSSSSCVARVPRPLLDRGMFHAVHKALSCTQLACVPSAGVAQQFCAMRCHPVVASSAEALPAHVAVDVVLNKWTPCLSRRLICVGPRRLANSRAVEGRQSVYGVGVLFSCMRHIIRILTCPMLHCSDICPMRDVCFSNNCLTGKESIATRGSSNCLSENICHMARVSVQLRMTV